MITVLRSANDDLVLQHDEVALGLKIVKLAGRPKFAMAMQPKEGFRLRLSKKSRDGLLD